jgi:protein involved in polysaccharide export with SLBB domain
LTNPVSNGIPVCLLPPELLAEPKSGKETLPLTYLRQKQPDVYRLGPEDVLSVYVEGVLGDRGQPPPVNFPENVNLPPAMGYPMPVRQNGTLPLPLIEPLKVDGMTVDEAQRAIVKAYTTGAAPILQANRARIIVTLIRPRHARVLVVRQDSPAGGLATTVAPGVIRSTRLVAGGSEVITGGPRRGVGMIVDLPAYENDVLNALAVTGGLPGLDAANEIVIQRGYLCESENWDAQFNGDRLPSPPSPATMKGEFGGEIVRIPLRLRHGQPPPFCPKDIILHTGDIVFIEARDTEVFYTGGLLPSGEFPLPRDHDLDVVGAICAVGGPLVNGGFNSNNLSGALVAPGIGGPSPSLLTVLRRTPDGRQVTILVDLTEALRDPRESLLLRAGDVLILQESKDQALARYFTQNFAFSLISNVIQTSRTTGTTSLKVP